MNQFRRVKMYGGFALALAMALSWQQVTGAKAEIGPVWVAPLDAPVHLINPYRQPNSDYSAGHRGVDYQVEDKQLIYAPTEATVSFNHYLVDRAVLVLKTDSGDLLEFEPACSSLAVGSRVMAGDAIAEVCPASPEYRQHCEGGLCLHFSLRTARGYLSPIVRYGALAPSVLLPVL